MNHNDDTIIEPASTVRKKDEQRDDIESQTEAFLSSGGQVTSLPGFIAKTGASEFELRRGIPRYKDNRHKRRGAELQVRDK